MSYISLFNSPLGQITLESDGENLTGLYLAGQKGKNNDSLCKNDDLELFAKTRSWLERYFAGQKPSVSKLSLSPQGSEFCKCVWEELIKIPYGQTTSYGAIAKLVAKKLGKEKMSARAVGAAIGRNPISIIIPCHRVIGANGNLTGYSGGLQTKIKLLQIENVDMKNLIFKKNRKKVKHFKKKRAK